MNNSLPLVSVTIPTLNSGKTLETTLISIKKQTYLKIEIIVADGNSTDNTLTIAKKYNSKICFASELGRARYEALQKSIGDYVFALDSDQFIDTAVIEKCVKLMEHKKYDALILREKSILRKKTLIGKIIAYDKLVINSSNDKDPIFGSSIPRFFTRKSLAEIKWPKTLSILDDAVLLKEFIKENRKIGLAQYIHIQHYEVDSLSVFFKKFIRYGKLYIPTMRVSPEATIIHSLPRKTYFTKRVLSKPNILLGLIILYTIKVIAVLTGITIYLFGEIFNKDKKK